jgi:hypothetical protein
MNGRGWRWARRIGWWLGGLGATGLALLGAAYWLTYEPAPRIRVLWRDGVTAHQQAEIEERYLLLNGRDRIPGGSVAYDLLDTSRSNIKSIVEDPAIADTNDIERHTYVVPFETQYGNEWMWMAHRVPLLRENRVRTALISGLALMTVFGTAIQIASRLKAG